MSNPNLSAPFVPGKAVISMPQRRGFAYKLGSDDPPIKPDAGAGAFFQKSPQPNMRTLRDTILGMMPMAIAFVGDDAAKHLQHYLERSGREYVIDLEGMVKEVTSAGVLFQQALDEAQDFAATLGPGQHAITSSVARSGNNDVTNRNWHYALGGYAVWGKGEVSASVSQPALYTLHFEYKFFDRYNWDKGKEVNLSGIKITDQLMGEFHRQGLAREFNMVGSLKRTVSGKRSGAVAGKKS